MFFMSEVALCADGAACSRTFGGPRRGVFLMSEVLMSRYPCVSYKRGTPVFLTSEVLLCFL